MVDRHGYFFCGGRNDFNFGSQISDHANRINIRTLILEIVFTEKVNFVVREQSAIPVGIQGDFHSPDCLLILGFHLDRAQFAILIVVSRCVLCDQWNDVSQFNWQICQDGNFDLRSFDRLNFALAFDDLFRQSGVFWRRDMDGLNGDRRVGADVDFVFGRNAVAGFDMIGQ